MTITKKLQAPAVAPTSDTATTTPTASKNPKDLPFKKRRGRPVKPRDMPSRPLSAYNLYFAATRTKILRDVEAGDLPADYIRHALAAAQQQGDNAKHSTTEAADVEQQVPTRGPAKNQAIAKTIASRWKDLDSATRSKYQAEAAVEKEAYQRRLREYFGRKKEGHPPLQRQSPLPQQPQAAAKNDNSILSSCSRRLQQLFPAAAPTTTTATGVVDLTQNSDDHALPNAVVGVGGSGCSLLPRSWAPPQPIRPIPPEVPASVHADILKARSKDQDRSLHQHQRQWVMPAAHIINKAPATAAEASQELHFLRLQQAELLEREKALEFHLAQQETRERRLAMHEQQQEVDWLHLQQQEQVLLLQLQLQQDQRQEELNERLLALSSSNGLASSTGAGLPRNALGGPSLEQFFANNKMYHHPPQQPPLLAAAATTTTMTTEQELALLLMRAQQQRLGPLPATWRGGGGGAF